MDLPRSVSRLPPRSPQHPYVFRVLKHTPLPQVRFGTVCTIHERFKYLFCLGIFLLFQLRPPKKNLARAVHAQDHPSPRIGS